MYIIIYTVLFGEQAQSRALSRPAAFISQLGAVTRGERKERGCRYIPAVWSWGMLLAESHSARLFLGVSDGKMTGNGNSPLYCVIVYTLWGKEKCSTVCGFSEHLHVLRT